MPKEPDGNGNRKRGLQSEGFDPHNYAARESFRQSHDLKTIHVNSEITRRQFLKATGALVVAFGLPVTVRAQSAPAPHTSGGPLPPGQIDSWLIIGKDGRVTVMTGKVELGTGVSTSLRQIVAEELDYPFEKINWIQGDTANTVDQAPTFGSQTIKRGGSQLRQAAAEAKAVLLSLASERLGMPIEQLAVSQGVISAQGDAKRTVSYVDLLGGQQFNREVTGKLKPKSTSTYNIVGKPVPRIDIPFKAAGVHVYMQNLRIPGMLHGRPVRPPQLGAKLVRVDESSVKDISGFVKVVVKGNFVGVVCEREEQAIRVARDLKVTWDGPQTLPPMSELFTRPYERFRATAENLPKPVMLKARWRAPPKRSMPLTNGHSNCTLPLVHLAELPTLGTEKQRSGLGLKERINFARPSRSCWESLPPMFEWCLLKRPDVTATTARTMLRPMPRCSPRLSESPSAYSGCDTTSMAGSRWDRRWLWTFAVVLIRKEMWSRGTIEVWTPTHSSRPNGSPEVCLPAH